MALAHRSAQRVSGSIWPGFVDAMAALLLVMIFLLTIFMFVQAVLRETITGQETRLGDLAAELSALSEALGLSEQETAQLRQSVATLQGVTDRQAALIVDLTGQIDAQAHSLRGRDETIARLQGETDRQAALIANLTGQIEVQERSLRERDEAISDIEAQVAALLVERDRALAEGRLLASEAAQLRADVEARDVSLAEAFAALEQSKITEAEAAASLARALAELSKAQDSTEADAAVIRELQAQAESARAELDAREAARLAEAAIAEALRERLRNSDAELTALSLRLEQERKEAEETLVLLAAANAAEEDLNARLAEVIAKLDRAEDLLGQAEGDRDSARTELARLTAARDRLQDEVATLRDVAQDAETLRQELASALAARLAAEGASKSAIGERERRQRLLDAANRRLAEEREISSKAQREVALLNAQVADLRNQLAELAGLLDSAEEQDRQSKVRIEALGSRLNQALARAAAEARRRAELEAKEAERLRREKELLAEEAGDLATYRSEFFGTLRQVLGDREGVRIVGDRFLFSSEVLFESGSATLLPEGRDSIREVAQILDDVAGEIPPNLDWILRVDGHTDNAPVLGTGEFADNWELSAGRALSVVKYMTEALDFPPKRLAAAGFGEYRPVAPGDSDAARAQNRRIELKLTER